MGGGRPPSATSRCGEPAEDELGRAVAYSGADPESAPGAQGEESEEAAAMRRTIERLDVRASQLREAEGFKGVAPGAGIPKAADGCIGV